MNNPNEIKRLANLLASNAKFKLDYTAVLNKTRKILLVEGSTDRSFINKIKTDIVDCMVADQVFNNNAVFSTTASKTVNCKNAIATLIFGLTRIPSTFIIYPENIDQWDIYGMVDLDCDELNSGIQIPRLFVTDTHDLETLLISTDDDVFYRIDNCEVSEQDIKKSFFVAYQLAKSRELLGNYHDNQEFNLGAISSGSHKLDFSLFVQDDKISLFDLCKYITENSNNKKSSTKLKKLTTNIVNDKSFKKKYNVDGIWKQELSRFDYKTIPDFWISVNGHDILQLIRYYNKEVDAVFDGNDSTKLNRKFETALIEKYDYSKISATQLYANMKAESLVI